MIERRPVQRNIYDLAARAVVAALVCFLFAILLRFLTRQLLLERGVQNRFTSAIFFDVPELAALPTETGEPSGPAELTPERREALRDADGILWTEIDWAALYPPPAQAEAGAPPTGAERFAAWIDGLQEKTRPYETRVADAEARVTDYATDYVAGYGAMVEAANAYDRLLGWEIAGVESYNPVVKLEGNYFITCVARQDRAERAREIISLRDFCAENGMRHLYVTTPNDACREDTGVSGVMDFYNQNADRLQKALRDADVETMDLRDSLHADGMDHHASFYETDHHWRPETGLWAAGKIAERLNADYGFGIDLSLFDASRWRGEVYEDWFLGSQGKKVTLSRAEPEDFTLLYPLFDTRLRFEVPSMDLDRTGGFSVQYRYGVLAERDYYGQSPYLAYFYGDNALTRVRNELSSDGKHVLVLGHSFDNCVLPFLALGVEYLDSIDLREFTGSIEAYLLENRYDVVIELYTE